MARPGLDRRRLLQGGAVALGGAGVGWTAASAIEPEAAGGATNAPVVSQPLPGNRIEPFHGAHQAGIATMAQAHLALVGIDLAPGVGRDDLARMMRLLSDDAARLTRGAPPLADNEPELADLPARLTVTFGFGPRVMNHLLDGDGLAPLPAFGTDALQEHWGQTDVAVQICADDPTTSAHARRMLLKDSAAFGTVRWIQHGFRNASQMTPVSQTPRNLMGQVDGTVNPAEADPDFASLIWSNRADLNGGTFMVVRRIRMHLDTWDEVDRTSREAVIGRNLDNGAPLSGTREDDTADFGATDSLGLPVIDPVSHMALATAQTAGERMLRRPYNYTVPDPDQPGGEDSGLIFLAYVADVDAQFNAVQRRLASSDRLNQWITHIGSAVYALPPGAAEGEFVGQHLLES